MRYIFLGILSSFLFAAAVNADTSSQSATHSATYDGASSTLPRVTQKTHSPVQRILRLGWDPLLSGLSNFHLTTLHLKKTGYYLYRTLTFPVELASSSYRQVCHHLSCLGSTKYTRVVRNETKAGARKDIVRAIDERYTFEPTGAQHGKLHLAYAASNALDISLHLQNFPVEGLPEAHPTAQISQKPLGRTIGLQFEFRF